MPGWWFEPRNDLDPGLRDAADTPMSLTESRLTVLEIKYMEQSDLVEQLNQELQAVNNQLNTAIARVQRMERQLEEVRGSLDAPSNERPPHY
jgi:SlyX protein